MDFSEMALYQQRLYLVALLVTNALYLMTIFPWIITKIIREINFGRLIGDHELIRSQFRINYEFFNNSCIEEKNNRPSNKLPQQQYRAEQRWMKKLEIMEKEATITPNDHSRQQEEVFKHPQKWAGEMPSILYSLSFEYEVRNRFSLSKKESEMLHGNE